MAFRIETLTLPAGARLGISPLPGRNGPGLSDVAKIARWGADVVVSMTEMAEMERHDIGDLGAMLGQFEIAWRHFPVRDFGTPAMTARWDKISRDLHQVLDGGGSVLAHCYGGHGRSGMVVVRLLCERGISPDAALRDLRAIRPGAVETEAQFDWASLGAGRAVC